MKLHRAAPDPHPGREKFAQARRELSSALIERDEEIDLILTALLSHEHVLLVGPPGCGKSLLLDSLLAWTGGTKFSILFTKFTVPEEVVGPVSLSALKEDRYVRVTAGKLPEADYAFLDEVMKAKHSMRLLLADRVKDDLVKLARGQTADGVSLDEAADALAAWDNTASRDSRGSVLFVDFATRYLREAKKPFAVPWSEKQPVTTPSGLGEGEAARKALAASVKEVKAKHGSLTVPWGDVYRLRRGSLELDPAAHRVTFRGRVVELSAREFTLLHALMLNAGRVLSREQLEERLYPWGREVESNAVEVHIHHLRRKLAPSLIRTIRGVGYLMPRETAAESPVRR